MKNKSIILATLLLAAPTLKSCGPSFFADAIVYESHKRQEKTDVRPPTKEVVYFCGNYRVEMDSKSASDKADKIKK